MPKTTSPQIPRRLAARHDAVFDRLQALTRAVQGQAGRAPGRVVPEAVRVAAETLLFEAKAFREPRRRVLPAAAPHYAGLAVQLGEALAAMVAFETSHTQWNGAINDAMWMVPGAMMQPRRLRPRPGSKGAGRCQGAAGGGCAGRARRHAHAKCRIASRAGSA